VTSRILLVEGVPGVGKSTLLHGVQRRRIESAFGARSALHLSQAHTYGPLAPGEDAGTLTAAENIAHLSRLLDLVETFASSERGRHPTFVSIDTLHITHCVRPGVVSLADVRAFDDRLASLGASLVVLRAQPETLWQRAVWGRRETGFIQGYAMRRFGGTLEAVHQHFVREQERLLGLVEGSRLAKSVLDAELDAEEIVERAYPPWGGA
jgi:hypothetical protein